MHLSTSLYLASIEDQYYVYLRFSGIVEWTMIVGVLCSTPFPVPSFDQLTNQCSCSSTFDTASAACGGSP